MPTKVLIVDDEKPVRELFGKLLLKEDCTTKEAASGEEALEMIKNEDFDAVLLDIRMPGIDGVETLKRINVMKPGQTVVMLTALGYDEDLIAQCKENKCAGYLGKNMPLSQIISNFKLFLKAGKEKIGK